jgi:hypothetical protein
MKLLQKKLKTKAQGQLLYLSFKPIKVLAEKKNDQGVEMKASSTMKNYCEGKFMIPNVTDNTVNTFLPMMKIAPTSPVAPHLSPSIAHAKAAPHTGSRP